MKKIVWILLFISCSVYGQTDEPVIKKYEISFECKMEDLSNSDLYINLYEVGRDKNIVIKTISNSYKCKLTFEYQKDYLITFEKSGFIKKEISVSTKNISLKRWNDEFAPLKSSIQLAKQPEDSFIKFSEPIAFISYSDSLGEFKIKPNY